MRYTTTNELAHFGFSESYIAAIQKINGYFQFTLNNVTILPENSCNRDVRPMRTNGLNLKIQDGCADLLVEEGYKVYDADGNLKQQQEDQTVSPEHRSEVLKELSDGMCSIYSLEEFQDSSGHTYTFAIDASDDRTYLLRITGTRDIEEWDHFFNK